MNIYERYGRQNIELEQTKESGLQRAIIAQLPDASIEMQYFATMGERIRCEKAPSFKFRHVRPDSVCVVGIGTTWEPGAWQKVVDMVEYTNAHDIACWLSEVADSCGSIPYLELPQMRDDACLYAHNNGFEWVLLMENDAMPEPDLLTRLIGWQKQVVAPYVKDPVSNKILAYPQHDPNTGLQLVRWAVLTCLLIWTKVLNCFPNCQPFNGMVGESDFYHRLIHYGHIAHVDTNTELKVATRPSYPKDEGSLDGLLEMWRRKDAKRRQMPNRQPINPQDKRELYLPEGINLDDYLRKLTVKQTEQLNRRLISTE